jgi:8-oxo-dGTP diphosphatase
VKEGAGPDHVQAAGGVVWRRSPAGIEVLLVHRPRYDDWTFPKGKLDAGEDHRSAALREVEEETGLRPSIGPELTWSEYLDGRGRPKVVRWWAMTPSGGAFVAGHEVDHVRWVPVVDAPRALTYERDLDVLRSFTARPETAAVLLVRHGHAGDRRLWEGDDRLRPLSDKGWRQARALVGLLRGYAITRVASSASLRCVQTVEPLARARGLGVETSGALAEGAERDRVSALLDDLTGVPAVLSTHGDVAGEALALVGRRRAPCAKGSVWVLEPDGDRLVAARYVPPPA